MDKAGPWKLVEKKNSETRGRRSTGEDESIYNLSAADRSQYNPGKASSP